MTTRARKGRIIVASNVAGKPVNAENRTGNSIIVYNEEEEEYQHVPLPEGLPPIDELMDYIWQEVPASFNSDASSVGLLARDGNMIYVSLVAGTEGNGRWGRFLVASEWSNE